MLYMLQYSLVVNFTLARMYCTYINVEYSQIIRYLHMYGVWCIRPVYQTVAVKQGYEVGETNLWGKTRLNSFEVRARL